MECGNMALGESSRRVVRLSDGVQERRGGSGRSIKNEAAEYREDPIWHWTHMVIDQQSALHSTAYACNINFIIHSF
jgi:hypothetical protein